MRTLALVMLAGCFSLPERPADGLRMDGSTTSDGLLGDGSIPPICVDDDFNAAASRECGDWAQQTGFGLRLERTSVLRASHNGVVGTLACTSQFYELAAPAQVTIVEYPTANTGALGMKLETSTGDYLMFTLRGGSQPTVSTNDTFGIATQDAHTGTPYFRIRTDAGRRSLVVERSTNETDWDTVAQPLSIPQDITSVRMQLFMTFDQGVNAGGAAFDDLRTCP